MAKYFSTAGPCRPEHNYMLPAVPRVAALRPLIDRGEYFVVHAPRQAGKTTSLRALAEVLTAEGRYVALHTSCETGQLEEPNLDLSINGILAALRLQAEHALPEELRPPATDPEQPPTARLLDLLTRWASACPRPVVLFLDEIDALFDDALISVLRQLRSGYPSRPGHFVHSVALIGLRDVRDYRLGSSKEAERLGTASPFNIKSDSLRLPNFTESEVGALYAQHTDATGQVFAPGVTERVTELTDGQPWLVNALARQLVETVASSPEDDITVDHLDLAQEILIRRRDTHLDSLLDRLREPRVRRVLEPMLAGEPPNADALDDDYRFVEDLGLIKLGENGLEIANPIYREIIPRALTTVAENFVPMRRASYIEENGRLSWPALLDGFADFWKTNAEWMLRQQPYSEAAAQLTFMAFLHRLVNGLDLEGRSAIATVDREYAVGRGRVDILVRWPLPDGRIQRFAAELKVRRDRDGDPLEEGLLQLSGYLTRLGLDNGTLVLFDLRTEAPPLADRVSRAEVLHAGRRIDVLRL